MLKKDDTCAMEGDPRFQWLSIFTLAYLSLVFNISKDIYVLNRSVVFEF